MRMKKIAAVLISCLLAAGSLMTAQAAEKERLPKVSDVWWEDSVAHWEEVDDAYKYEVTLYRDSSKVKTIDTKNTKYNFESSFTKAADYKFKVRALGKRDYSDGPWSDYSDTFDVSETYVENIRIEKEEKKASSIGKGTSGPGEGMTEGEWVQDQTGWWYREADGTYPANAWRMVKEAWYFFGEDGYMKTGWIDWNHKRYYCDGNGAMVTGSYAVDGVTYNFGGDGALIE